MALACVHSCHRHDTTKDGWLHGHDVEVRCDMCAVICAFVCASKCADCFCFYSKNPLCAKLLSHASFTPTRCRATCHQLHSHTMQRLHSHIDAATAVCSSAASQVINLSASARCDSSTADGDADGDGAIAVSPCVSLLRFFV